MHTPGPWTIVQRQSVVEIVADNPDHADIATIWLADANARLIAAVPDLLAACRRISDTEWDGTAVHSFAECREIARAAIAKATL